MNFAHFNCYIEQIPDDYVGLFCLGHNCHFYYKSADGHILKDLGAGTCLLEVPKDKLAFYLYKWKESDFPVELDEWLLSQMLGQHGP